MTAWYYSDAMNRRQGPVDTATLAGLQRQGGVDEATLVWRDGLAEWQPLRTLLSEILATPAFAPDTTATAPDTASQVHDYASAAAIPVSSPASPYTPPASPLAEQDDFQSGGEVVYAGFWKRFAALAIDSFVIGIAYYGMVIAMMIVLGLGAGMMEGSAAAGGMFALVAMVYLIYPLLSVLYYVGFESSSRQATLGKMAVGIKVTDASGRRLSRGQAVGRWFSHLLSYFTLYIGYLMAGFTDRKRGLHDMVAGTLVVDRWAYTASPQQQRRELGAVTIVVMVLALLAILAYAAIVLAIAIPAYHSYVQRAAGV